MNYALRTIRTQKILFLVGVLALFQLSYGQQPTEFLEQQLQENALQDRLPPLDSLIRWAQNNSPQTRFYQADEEFWALEEQAARNNWLQAISLNGGYSYGIFDNLSNQQLAGDPNASQVLLSTTQSRFNLSASVSIPLDLIFGRKRQIQSAQADREKSIASNQSSLLEIRDAVISQYYELILAYDNFMIANAMLDSYRIAAQRAHNDFRNGVITYEQFNSIQSEFNTGIQKKNSRRIELVMGLKKLESLIGKKINLRDEI